MNENELKNRLQHDAELFSKVFDEELYLRIRNEILNQPVPLRESRPHHSVFQYAVLICSSVLIGIGVWSLMRHQTQSVPGSLPGTEIDMCQSDSRPNIAPAPVSTSSVPTFQEQPSASEVPNGTFFNLSVPKPQSLEELPLVLIPGHGLVRLNTHVEPQSEEEEENVMGDESASNFLNEAREVVRVPMGWILEE